MAMLKVFYLLLRNKRKDTSNLRVVAYLNYYILVYFMGNILAYRINNSSSE